MILAHSSDGTVSATVYGESGQICGELVTLVIDIARKIPEEDRLNFTRVFTGGIETALPMLIASDEEFKSASASVLESLAEQVTDLT